jgi:hypothetical protein
MGLGIITRSDPERVMAWISRYIPVPVRRR